MLIDPHAHTSEISLCCRIGATEVLQAAKAAGLDGIVLTNHYQKSYVRHDNPPEFAKKYIKEYEYTKQIGYETGLHVFFGIEVTTALYKNVHMLIYGTEPSFCLRFPDMYDYPLDELSRIVHKSGGVLIQAHPFRNGTHVLDTQYLDGLEINSHPLYNVSYADELTKIADQSGLILTCGGDYHADTYRPLCGTYFPETTADSIAIGAFLRTTKNIRLRIHEPNTESYYETDYIRKEIQ